MKTKTTVIYNENDGHSYVWSDAECDWIGFETFQDGEPDWLKPSTRRTGRTYVGDGSRRTPFPYPGVGTR